MAEKKTYTQAEAYRMGLTDVPPEADPDSLLARAKAGTLGSAIKERWDALPGFNALMAKAVPGYREDEGLGNKILDVLSVPARVIANPLIEMASPEHRQMVVEHALNGDPTPAFLDATGITTGGMGTAATMGRRAAMAGEMGGDALGMAIPVKHVTPHEWAPEPGHPHGRFDPSKAFSGEGAMVYGPGLYTAENPKVWDDYYSRFSGPGEFYFQGLPVGNFTWLAEGQTPAHAFMTYKNMPLYAAIDTELVDDMGRKMGQVPVDEVTSFDYHSPASYAIDEVGKQGGDIDKAIQSMRNWAEAFPNTTGPMAGQAADWLAANRHDFGSMVPPEHFGTAHALLERLSELSGQDPLAKLEKELAKEAQGTGKRAAEAQQQLAWFQGNREALEFQGQLPNVHGYTIMHEPWELLDQDLPLSKQPEVVLGRLQGLLDKVPNLKSQYVEYNGQVFHRDEIGDVLQGPGGHDAFAMWQSHGSEALAQLERGIANAQRDLITLSGPNAEDFVRQSAPGVTGAGVLDEIKWQRQRVEEEIANFTAAKEWLKANPDAFKPASPLHYGDYSGADLVADLQNALGHEQTRQAMIEAGIPGTQYLDGYSRGKGPELFYQGQKLRDADIGTLINDSGRSAEGYALKALKRHFVRNREMPLEEALDAVKGDLLKKHEAKLGGGRPEWEEPDYDPWDAAPTRDYQGEALMLDALRKELEVRQPQLFRNYTVFSPDSLRLDEFNGRPVLGVVDDVP